MKGKKPWNAVHLRLFAMLFMLLDHMWLTIAPGQLWMHCLGRLAFPIFAFQAAEGYFHTSNFRRYLGRLLVFAILSEVPLDLMAYGTAVFPGRQNVLFTMLLGLLAIHATERLRNPIFKISALCLLVVAGDLTFVDYGAAGVLTVAAFGILRGRRLEQLLALALLNTRLFLGGQRLWGWFPVQEFAVLSLGFLWLYNGQRGPRNKLVQYAAYWFYPVHMLALYLLELTL